MSVHRDSSSELPNHATATTQGVRPSTAVSHSRLAGKDVKPDSSTTMSTLSAKNNTAHTRSELTPSSCSQSPRSGRRVRKAMSGRPMRRAKPKDTAAPRASPTMPNHTAGQNPKAVPPSALTSGVGMLGESAVST